jgi:hypothetical protein
MNGRAYRIKDKTEKFERVVTEQQISQPRRALAWQHHGAEKED